MISSLFSSTKPIATAESPAYEFSSEITVGMSAPPIGMISSTPKTSDSRSDQRRTATTACGSDDEIHAGADGDREQRQVDDVLAAIGDRPRRHDLLQLAGGHQAAGERQAAEDHLDGDRAGPERGQLAVLNHEHVLRPCRRAPAARPPNACDSAVRCGTAVSGTRDSGMPMTVPTTIASDDPGVVDDPGCEQRADDRERHPADAGRHAAARGLRVAQPAQRQDEERRRGEIAGLGEVRPPLLAPPLAEHLQHAVGDQEAADDVGHRGGDGDRAEDGGERWNAARRR